MPLTFTLIHYSTNALPELSEQSSSKRQEMGKEVRSELQCALEEGMNDRKREEMKIKQQEESAL